MNTLVPNSGIRYAHIIKLITEGQRSKIFHICFIKNNMPLVYKQNYNIS